MYLHDHALLLLCFGCVVQVSGWSGERGPISVNGRGYLATLTIAGANSSLPPRRSIDATSLPLRHLAGYEGRRGRVCLASSDDGQQYFNIDNEYDRRGRGLNDDCLTAPGVAGSNSILARAADTSILPVVDWKRGKEYIWYRKDFGTSMGWREVRTAQCTSIDTIVELSPPSLE